MSVTFKSAYLNGWSSMDEENGKYLAGKIASFLALVNAAFHFQGLTRVNIIFVR